MWYYTYIIHHIFPQFLFTFAIDMSKKFRFFSHDMGCNRALHTKIKLFRFCFFEDQMISIPFRIEIQSQELSECVVDSSGGQFFTRLYLEEQWNRHNSAINSQRKSEWVWKSLMVEVVVCHPCYCDVRSSFTQTLWKLQELNPLSRLFCCGHKKSSTSQNNMKLENIYTSK